MAMRRNKELIGEAEDYVYDKLSGVGNELYNSGK